MVVSFKEGSSRKIADTPHPNFRAEGIKTGKQAVREVSKGLVNGQQRTSSGEQPIRSSDVLYKDLKTKNERLVLCCRLDMCSCGRLVVSVTRACYYIRIFCRRNL